MLPSKKSYVCDLGYLPPAELSSVAVTFRGMVSNIKDLEKNYIKYLIEQNPNVFYILNNYQGSGKNYIGFSHTNIARLTKEVKDIDVISIDEMERILKNCQSKLLNLKFAINIKEIPYAK